MGFRLRRARASVDERPQAHDGGWYADPFGVAARRWYDHVRGWTDRVQGAGEAPDKTGLARMDEAAVAAADAARPLDAEGEPEPLSRPVDPKYMLNARPASAGATQDGDATVE
jgi:hypothetical protein